VEICRLHYILRRQSSEDKKAHFMGASLREAGLPPNKTSIY
jgi:hypothetical protein